FQSIVLEVACWPGRWRLLETTCFAGRANASSLSAKGTSCRGSVEAVVDGRRILACDGCSSQMRGGKGLSPPPRFYASSSLSCCPPRFFPCRLLLDLPVTIWMPLGACCVASPATPFPAEAPMAGVWHGPTLSDDTLAFGPLALIAPLLQRLDIADIIDAHLPPDPQLAFSHGRVLSLL